MARDLKGTGTYITLAGGAVHTTVPMTMACWFIDTNNPAIQGVPATRKPTALLSITSSTRAKPEYQLGTVNNAADTQRRVQVRTRGVFFSSVVAQGSVDVFDGNWHHACAVFPNNNTRIAYTDGVDKVSVSGFAGPSFLDQTAIGVRQGTSTSEEFIGPAAEFAVWAAALGDIEIASLGIGVSPLFVRPQSLIYYAPLMGRNSPEPDYLGARDGALVGSVPAYPHPFLLRPMSYTVTDGEAPIPLIPPIRPHRLRASNCFRASKLRASYALP